jgi:hypothetical protein
MLSSSLYRSRISFISNESLRCLLGPDANVGRGRQRGSATTTGAFAEHLVERLLDHTALVVRQVQAAKHHLAERMPHTSQSHSALPPWNVVVRVIHL